MDATTLASGSIDIGIVKQVFPTNLDIDPSFPEPPVHIDVEAIKCRDCGKPGSAIIVKNQYWVGTVVFI